MNTSELKVTSPLNHTEIKDERRCGNTIRLIDTCISLLFKGDIVVCEDHYNNGNDYISNRILFNKVSERLRHEHTVILEYMFFDFKNNSIYLVPNNKDVSEYEYRKKCNELIEKYISSKN